VTRPDIRDGRCGTGADRSMNRLQRAIVPGLLLAAAYYAVFGGEFSVFELRDARASLEVERAALVTVQTEIDSLEAWADSLQNDPLTIERIAREEFGMIREGETLYRFAETVPDADDGREADER
jgi:cell division protein FtsB